jgi:acyl-coenzyme A synthetase/AMP-(fatty) acid ligase
MICKNESPVTGEDIKRWRSLLLNKVEPLVVPRLWRNVTEFPMTAQGKLDTACLLELFDE